MLCTLPTRIANEEYSPLETFRHCGSQRSHCLANAARIVSADRDRPAL